MRPLRYILGILASICLIIALLIGSVELCCFYQRDFWRDTFAEEQSYETVGMSLEDETALAHYMLDYLQGKYGELTYITTMWGEQRDFFNQREKDHMIDVQALNLNAVHVMRISVELFVLFLIVLLAISFKTSARDYAHNMILLTLARSFLAAIAIVALLMIAGIIFAVSDFDYFWRCFHYIFFPGNDLWLLDPNVDMLINVTTGTLFEKLVARCALLFGIILVALLLASVIYLVLAKKKKWVIKLGSVILLAGALTLPTAKVYAEDTIISLENPPEISADCAILIDAESGRTLYSKNALDSAYPASTTKVMTALLALENLDLKSPVTFSKAAIYALTKGASHIGMTVGEVLTAEQCLYGLLLPSANEVANALAEAVDGSMPAFVDHMNERAAELKCYNTHFANPNGLHDENHTTCAYDLAQIFRACIETPGFMTIDSAVTYVIPATNLIDEARPMKTTHKMMQPGSEYYDERVVCGKTGHTDEALGCLITYAQEGGRSLICVVLHAEQPGQYTDTKALFDYGFSRFAKTSSQALSEYLFSANSSTAYRFSESSNIPLYTIDSSDFLLLTADLSDLRWEFDSEMIHLGSGNLDLGYVNYSVTQIDKSIYSGGLLPIENYPKLQIAKEDKSISPLLWIIPSVLAGVVLIFLFMRSKLFIRLRKKHTTHIIKNPGTKNIKL